MAASWCRMKTCYEANGLKLYKSSNCVKTARCVVKHIQNTYRTFSQSVASSVENNVLPKKTSSEKKDVSGPLPRAYDPVSVEDGWYEWWCQQKFFQAAETKTEAPFVMVLPPPNVTGTLHLGHALTNSVQDAIIRWHRMKGRDTVWVPGCDHAGIATQVVVEKKLWQERQLSRHQLGREKFLEEVWKWKEEKGDVIFEQMKKLGSCLDWSRACFTMDEKLSRAVTEAFVRLHDEGLIYRSNRLVNWSCALRSTISDIEVDNVSLEGRTNLPVPGYDKKVPFGVLSSFAYPLHEQDGEIVVSTTRVETMLGDVGVAVHPDDSRYTHLHGQHVTHPFTGRQLPIICDAFVDMKFGTGAVKLTPAHDPTDFLVGERHDLQKLEVIDDTGLMVNVPEQFHGLKRFDARRILIAALKEMNLFRGEQDHNMSVPMCSRSKDIVEPRIKAQWFLSCQDMAQCAARAVESGELELIPASHKKIWMDWMLGIRDWCISRQLWWGHRIPAYKFAHNGETVWVSGRSELEARTKMAKKLGLDPDSVSVEQDQDVLDTWFSSALFPFSVFGWPHETQDLQRFYPTSLLETGSDILFFWVARMVMLGAKLTGQLPFKQVLLHGILRDSQGRKMSKSLGNVIDPLDVICGKTLQELHENLNKSNLDPQEVKKAKAGQQKDFPNGIPQCGADALRFTLLSYDFKAGEINMDVVHAKSNRNFCNKIWQAFRFVQMNLGDNYDPCPFQLKESHSVMDKWILSRLSHMVRSCDTQFRTYDLHHVAQSLRLFWLTEFCDVYLECVKPMLQGGSAAEQENVRDVLFLCLDTYLRALSPFMPFLSEEVYQRLPIQNTISVCVAEYPQPADYPWIDDELDTTMTVVQNIAQESLSIRKEFNLTKSRASGFLTSTDSHLLSALSPFAGDLKVLSRSQDIQLMSSKDAVTLGSVQVNITDTLSLSVSLKGIIEPHKELPRLHKKKDKLEVELNKLLKNTNNSNEDSNDNKTAQAIANKRREIERLNSMISAVEELD